MTGWVLASQFLWLFPPPELPGLEHSENGKRATFYGGISFGMILFGTLLHRGWVSTLGAGEYWLYKEGLSKASELSRGYIAVFSSLVIGLSILLVIVSLVMAALSF